MIRVRILTLSLAICLLAACSPSQQTIQTAVAQTLTAIPTLTPVPTYTFRPTIVVTRIVIRTPEPTRLIDERCTPLANMDYSDNSKVMIQLQGYVSKLPGVKSVSYVIPEKVYSNSISQLLYITYVASDDGKVYSKRYIVFLEEFGWKNAVFSIDGQCWIDPPKR